MTCAACESPAPNPAVIFTVRRSPRENHEQLRFCSRECVPSLWRAHNNHEEFDHECAMCAEEFEIARKHYSGLYQHLNLSRNCEECGTELETNELGGGMCVRCAWILKN